MEDVLSSSTGKDVMSLDYKSLESLTHVTKQHPFYCHSLALHQQQLWLAAQISCQKATLQRLEVFLMKKYSVEKLNDAKRKMCSSECNKCCLQQMKMGAGRRRDMIDNSSEYSILDISFSIVYHSIC